METNDVVVGVDGSAGGRQALRWAAAEAVRRGGRLCVVAGYRTPWPHAHAAAGRDRTPLAQLRAEDIVAEAVADAHAAAPGLEVSGLSVHGAPVPVLIAAAGGAPIVVGHRGHDGFAGLRPGATGLQLATHAPGPVVVVRGDADADRGPVLLGIDGSPGAEPAVALAFRTAAERGCGVLAVRAYQIPVPKWREPVDPLDFDLERLQAVEYVSLRGAVAPWRDKHPDVPVETVLRCGDPAEVLVAMSAQARLVVVGTRGHGGFTGLLLGSVGQKLMYHAHCPVLIAR
jgi:nucleotide-binding universal stress UspA family protein